MHSLHHFRSIARYGVRIAFAVLAAALSMTGRAQTVQLSPEQIKALDIVVAPVRPVSGMTLSGLSGQVVIPNNQIRVVSAPLPGLIEHLSVSTDQNVKAGQPLVRLQSPALVDIERGYLQALAQFQVATDAFERDRKLYAEGLIAESRFRTVEGQQRESSALVSERRQALRLTGLSEAAIDRLRATRILSSTIDVAAPMNGVVLEQLVQIGQRVEAAAPLYKIARLDALWVEVQLPTPFCGGVEQGATLAVPALNASGKVVTVSAQCAPNQSAMARALMSEGVERLRPGQKVEATLSLPAAGTPKWSIPTSAITRHDGRAIVFVAASSGFRAQNVLALNEGPDQTVVSGDFKEGDRIVVRGVASLKSRLLGIGGE